MVHIPQDRTISQPVEAFCRNPECAEGGREFNFSVEHDGFACPKCGADSEPMVGVLVLTHFIVPDPNGPISGNGGRKHKIACDSKRAYLATATNLEAATNYVQAVNCPGCLESGKDFYTVDASGARRLKMIKPTE